MTTLTKEETELLAKYELQRQKHRESQARYRQKLDKQAVKAYNKQYYDKKRAEINAIQSKLAKTVISTPIDLPQITKPPEKLDRRTRRGKKQAQTPQDIQPSYKTRKEPLAESTITDYIRKADIMQRLFTKTSLSPEVKAELKKLLNDNKQINDTLILSAMQYLANNKVDDTIQRLRDHYKNDNSFKSYVTTLTVIASHIPAVSKAYQTLTKTGIYVNKKVQEGREENVIDDDEKGKIISLNKQDIMTNIQKLTAPEDILLYALYTLFPARRLEWRLTRIATTETNANDLNGADNYIITTTSPMQVVFNNYKTKTTYGKQVFDISSNELAGIIHNYIKVNGLKDKDYVFHLKRDKREVISQAAFSKKVQDVFQKVYGEPISARFLRMSHVTHFLKTNPSLAAQKRLAEQMAHSVEEQARYRKLL